MSIQFENRRVVMTDDEAVHLIVDHMMKKLIDFAAGKNELEKQFERKFEELGEQKARGVRIYYPKSNYGEMMVAFFAASICSLTALDCGFVRYNKLSDKLFFAMAGASALDNDSNDSNELSRRYFEKAKMYFDYLDGAFSAGLSNFLAILSKAHVNIPKDPLEAKALAFRLWSLVCLEHVLLGQYFKVEHEGELCFMLLDMVNDVARNTERVFTEYCGPSPMPAAPAQKGCLLPLGLIFGVIFAATAAVRAMIA